MSSSPGTPSSKQPTHFRCEKIWLKIAVLLRLCAVWEEFLCIMDRQDGGKVASEIMKLHMCGNEVSVW